MLKPEHAAILIALCEANPDALAEAVVESGAEDPETLSTEILDALSEVAAEEVDEEEDPEEGA